MNVFVEPYLPIILQAQLSSTKTWSIALVDYSPFTERVAGVNSMLQKSEIVILHDSQEHRYFDIPSDFKL